MSDWTPSTEQVRSHYVFNQSNQWDPERGEAFDRWLAEHERQVAEKAWDEGRESVAADMVRPLDESGMRHSSTNPYRKERADD